MARLFESYYPASPDRDFLVTKGISKAQTFTAISSHKVSSIKLYLRQIPPFIDDYTLVADPALALLFTDGYNISDPTLALRLNEAYTW